MQNQTQTTSHQVNQLRYQDQPDGYYESYFLRANHPTWPLAFWIRYTLFCPKDKIEDALGEVWAIFFNGETNQHTVLKQESPLTDCFFDTSTLNIQIDKTTLTADQLQGIIEGKTDTLAWNLTFRGDDPPLFLLPLKFYEGGFPAAKSLVSLPMARYNGRVLVNSEEIEITDWVGSQNHNWGIRHTDFYAWGQVAGFDSHPENFLEVATARLRWRGPFWLPAMTPLVLRRGQKEYAVNSLFQAIKASGSFQYFTWTFKSVTAKVEIRGSIQAPAQAFVGLKYRNPQGGLKQCLNTKLASCTLYFKDKVTGITERMETSHRAAFEILTDDQKHGISLLA